MLQLMPVNLKDILLNCVHPALAQLVEQDEDQSRSIYRIKCIFNELNKTTQLTKGKIYELNHLSIYCFVQTLLSRLMITVPLFLKVVLSYKKNYM